MSSSVFKEYPSSLTDDGETKLNSNLVVFINKNGSVSVDPNALQDLLVNDATNTNTSVSVIRVSSPTPSLQQEFDEEDELERELAKMNTNSTDENGKGKDNNDEEDSDKDNDHDESNDSVADDCEVTTDKDESDRDEDDEDDENDDDDDDEDVKDKLPVKKVKNKSRKKKLAKLKKQLIEKIPHVSLTVENFYNPIEAKQLASDILSIAGITNPLQISVDFDFQRYVIANDHCYTPLTSPSQRNQSDGGGNSSSAQPSQTSSPKLTTKFNQKLNNTKIFRRKPLAKGMITKKPNTINDSLNAVGSDNEDNEIKAKTLADSAPDDDGGGGEEDAESYTSDESYESPSESENDRDSDLDFSVNDRPSSKVRKFRIRNLRQKQQQQQQQQQQAVAKQNSNSKYKKQRQNAAPSTNEGVINLTEDDSPTMKKTNKLSTSINNKSHHKKLLPPSQTPKTPTSSPSTTKSSKSVTVLIPPATNQLIKHTNKASIGRQMISSTTPGAAISQSTTTNNTTPSTTKLIIGNGTQQKIILTKMITPTTSQQKSKLNYLQPLAPILSISSGPPVPALAPISDTTKTTPGTPLTLQQQQQQQQAASKKDKKPPAHIEALFSDMTSLFSTPDIIKKVGNAAGNNSITSMSTQQSFSQSNNLLTPQSSAAPSPQPPPSSSAVTIPMNKCYFMPLTPQSQKNRNLPAQISIRTHQSSNSSSSSNVNADITPPQTTTATPFATEQDKEMMDLIDSIVQKELKNTTQLPATKLLQKKSSTSSASAASIMIPNIVKMLEHPVDLLTTNTNNQLLNNSTTTTVTPTTSTTSSFHSVTPITNHTQLLDDVANDLLGGFTVGAGTDDGLTEDLLQHVAKLVEDKNLQEVIDKQVLGVVTTGGGVGSGSGTINNHLNSAISTTNVTTTPIAVTAATIPTAIVTNLLTKLNKSTPTIRSDTTANSSLTVANNKLPTTPLTASSTNKTSTTTTPVTPVPAPKKEGIKIIRSDGRVITLPPIEAPTTRGAKRRAQNQPQDVNATPKRSSSVGSKSESTTPSSSSLINTNNIPKTTTTTTKDIVVVPAAKERRQSVQSVRKSVDHQTPKSKQKTTSTSSSGSAAMVTGVGGSAATVGTGDYDDFDDDDDGSDGSYNSEDDPFRLWCICRQPHNNRFMICCDKCEDWFHGKCVNVTKAMGVEMEERGVEWVCPACVKKQPSQLQQMFKKTIERQQQATTITTTTKQEENIGDPLAPSILSCIVCKRQSRPSSIYCSDDCIRKHAQTTTVNISTTAGATIVSAQALSTSKTTEIGSDVKNTQIKKTAPSSSTKQNSKISPSGSGSGSGGAGGDIASTNPNNRVDVFEPKTLRCLTGNSAPTIENLKRWLQEHPTFEIVHPGSAQAMAIKAKKQQLKNLAKSMEQDEQQNKFSTALQQSSKIQTTLKVGPSKRIVLVNPQQQKSPTTSSSTAASSPSANTKSNSSNPPKLITITQQQNTPTVQKSSPVSTPPASKTPTSKLITSNTGGNSTKNSNSPVNNKKKPSGGQSTSSSSSSSSGAAATTSSSSTEKEKQQNRTSNLEPIRVTVQKTLREQLTIRMAEEESKSPRLTPTEIDKFSIETEREIYYMFSKDTGTKYRTKYRSLMFNIKDRKNKTLFRKICDKTCQPKQLVRMSAAELASQELAQWRENENKHQLEMIKKSELDLLACAKNYVLKTHKGEEVIESKRIDQVQLDPSISVEDVVSVLNSATVTSTTAEQQITTQSTQSPIPLIKDTRIDSRFEKYLTNATAANNDLIASSILTTKSATPPLDKKKSSSSSSSTAAATASSSSSSSAHKRSRSRSKDRDGKKSSSTSSSSSSKHKQRRRSRDRSEDRSKKEANQQKDKKDSSNKKETKKSVDSSSTKLKQPTTTKEPPKPKKEDNFNLIDKILEAQSTIDRILRPDEAETGSSKSTPPTQPPPPPPPKSSVIMNKSISIESSCDQEPTSTVTIPTPPTTITDNSSSSALIAKNTNESTTKTITTNNTNKDGGNDEINVTLWSGSIVMVDVATFQINFNALSGDCSTIITELPIELDVVGRIQPDTVWDYIGKIKKSFNKEILLLQFFAEGEDDTEAYFTLYRYLSTRKRFGVIKTKSSLIKDFYILPLAAHKSLPSVLGAVDRIGFESNRQDMLLGIIVKNITATGIKRVISTTSTSSSSSTVPMAKVARIEKSTPPIASSLSKSKISAVMAEDRYTPPLSPKLPPAATATTSVQQSSVEAIGKTSQIIDKAIEDGDEPYSPGGSDEEIPIMSTIMKTTAPTHLVPTNPEQDEIERKMAELTRQIEAQKMVIAGMLQTETNQQQKLPSGIGINEPYSPTSLLDTTNQLDETSLSATTTTKTTPIPALSDIAIPSNLQEILNSINKVTTAASTMQSLTKQTDTASVTAVAAAANAPLAAPPAPIISHLISDSDEDDEEEEYTPTIGGKVLSTTYGYQPSSTALTNNPIDGGGGGGSSIDYIPSGTTIKNNEPSKLAQLTDEELLRMVPDEDLLMHPAPSGSSGGGGGGGVGHHHYQHHYQQQQYQQEQSSLPTEKYNPQLHNPPPPGLEDDLI